MNKNFISLFLVLLLLPFASGAASISITYDSVPANLYNSEASVMNGGITYDGLGTIAAIGGHVNINSGSFSDYWNVNIDPAAPIVTFSTTNPTFDTFAGQYSADGGVTWTALLLNLAGDELSTSVASIANIILHVTGNSGVGANAYDLRVAQVPVPAAVWLFGPAFMCIIGFTRRKYTSVTT